MNTEPWEFLQSGDVVRVVQGPLRGYGGIVVRTKNQTRLVICVSLLYRSVAVEIDPLWVQLPPALWRGRSAARHRRRHRRGYSHSSCVSDPLRDASAVRDCADAMVAMRNDPR